MGGWEGKQAVLLAELSSARARDGLVEEEEMRELITRALSQFEEFYEEKSRAAHRDVFQLFSPAWCSPLECAFYWITGFRPIAMLRLVPTAVDDLSPHQLLRFERLKSDIRWEEKALSDEHARIQETMAAPPVAGALQRVGRQLQGIGDGDPEADVAMQTVQAATEALVGRADGLRGKTAAGMIDILTMKQSIPLLEAAIRLQRNIKVLGMERQKKMMQL